MCGIVQDAEPKGAALGAPGPVPAKSTSKRDDSNKEFGESLF